jgi:hypothetical protein
LWDTSLTTHSAASQDKTITTPHPGTPHQPSTFLKLTTFFIRSLRLKNSNPKPEPLTKQNYE